MEQWRPRDIEWDQAPAETFTGDVLFGPVRNDGALNILAVSFSPGARTDWHHHPDGQVLYVTDGAGLVQNDEGCVVEISTGDLVHAPPGEVHWHGALPDSPMTHLSHTTGGATVWEPRKVTEEEYVSARDRASRAEPAGEPQATVEFSMPKSVKERLEAQAWAEYTSLSSLVVKALERASEPDSRLECLSSSGSDNGTSQYELVSGWQTSGSPPSGETWSQRSKVSQAAAHGIDRMVQLTGATRQDVCRALLYDYVTEMRPDWDAAELFD